MEALLSKIPIDQETRMQLAFLAAANGHVNIMHLMMPLDFLAYNKEGATLVTCAAYHNKTNVLAYLAEQKADLSLSDHNGETAAFVAARENIPDVIKQLEAYGIDLNRECNGLTPGHIASAFNQTQALVALFDARAGLYQSAESRKDRDTPLQLAIKNRQFEAIRLLLDWETSRVFAEDWRTKKSPIDFADDEVKAFIILHQLKKIY